MIDIAIRSGTEGELRLYRFSEIKETEGSVKPLFISIRQKEINMSEGRVGVLILCFFFPKKRVFC